MYLSRVPYKYDTSTEPTPTLYETDIIIFLPFKYYSVNVSNIQEIALRVLVKNGA